MYAYVKALSTLKKKMCKECICIFAYIYIYMSFHDKVKDLNGFINVF